MPTPVPGFWKESFNMNLTKYIRVTVEVEGANAKNCAYAYGAPPPSAPWGFARNLCLQSGTVLRGGAALVLHDYRDLGQASSFGRFTYSMLRSSDRDVARPNHTTSQIDLPKSNLWASIIFRVEADDTEAIDRLASLEPERFSGGHVTRCALSVHDLLSDALALVPPGFAMSEHRLDFDPTPRSLADFLTIRPGRPGWFTASLMGYSLMEEPRERVGARLALPHAYADPLVGVVKWESLYGLRRAGGAGLTFWGPSWVSSKTVTFSHS